VLARGREVIRLESDALEQLAIALDDHFVLACEAIFRTRRQLVVTGVGKSGHVARKVAATFAATDTPAAFLNPSEAAHGDLGMLAEGDTLLVFSNSGSTPELRPILAFARRLGVKIIGVASRAGSQLLEFADIALCIPQMPEACSANVAPTTSTTLKMAVGDALAMAVMDMRGVTRARLRDFHPGGQIGLQLTPISEIMHGAASMPLVEAGAGMSDVISTITGGRFGVAGVIDRARNLVGIITDGDLRRHFAELATATAEEVMTRSPKTIAGDTSASDALVFLNDNKITAAFVVAGHDNHGNRRPIGIVHIHDLLRLGLN
jgi:arabinose-5-phosphate isomerase